MRNCVKLKPLQNDTLGMSEKQPPTEVIAAARAQDLLSLVIERSTYVTHT